ncbi:FkbM family methyltransferase [Haliscomenobacter hydrossis]|nr:FkbM family methyltransferase [Haliscomenobacter hydrossis]
MKIISTNHIDVVFDVGANIGQYARKMRAYGYNKKIISFEPLHSAFEQLKIVAAKDNNWILNNYALGDEDVKSVINISDNSYSSSILNILPTHLDSAPQSKYIAKEEIEIKKIDTIFDSFCNNGDNVMVKIDTQGYEKNVIDGATASLDKIKVIQLEMSILPLYENEMLYMDMINYLDKQGFQLFSLENGFSDENTGQLLQVDGIFVQKRRHA